MMSSSVEENPGLRLKTAIALSTIYVMWGSTYLAIRFVVETMPPFLSASGRFFVAGVLMYAWLRFRGVAKPEATHWRSAFIIGGLLLVGGNGCVVWAEQRVPSGLASLLVSIAPLWMALFNWLRPQGHKPSSLTITGLVFGFFGLIVLIGTENLHVAEGFSVHLGAIIAAPILWALGSVYSKQAPLHESPFMTTAIQMIAGSSLLFLVGLFLGEPSMYAGAHFSTKSWMALLYLVIGGSFAGFTSYIWLLKHTPLPVASTYAYVNPVVAVLLGALVAGEPLTHNIIIGGVITVVSVALITRGSVKKKPLG